ncbi:permease prefix domain 1-containing protein [Neobacillus terrae]|uniref:permease prefix domain 1-containing protein n=1 Tax=Neobacillus terrae TaxID=3034837 RepID=UPI00140B8421|nr:permease prefix domain 1-containing protein [Neobacillus terrae]NHM31479.1 hypothetical protein [Neobacillus terrae]
MNEKLERFLNSVVSDLPMNEDEKCEFKEELYSHLNEHVNELIIKGFKQEEALDIAIECFGNERKLNRELKRSMFPFYKIFRYLWNVVFVTGFLCLVSFTAMEYYHPEFDNALSIDTVITGMFLVAIISGVAEVMYEAVAAEYKSKWLRNPWSFFLVPSLFIGALTTFSLIKHPDQYQEGLWLDLYGIPIGAVAHLFSRQLFTLIFLRNRSNFKRGRII